MIELLIGVVFLFLMAMPFAFGEQLQESELSSLGLIIFGLSILAYFNDFFLPLPLIINKGLIASMAIIDGFFQVFFGQGMAAFGGSNLLIFLITLSISYSLLRTVFSSLPMLSERGAEFITLAVLFVIARTTVTGGTNMLYLLGMTFINILLPNCSMFGPQTSTMFSMLIGTLLMVLPFIMFGGRGGGLFTVLMVILGLVFIILGAFSMLIPPALKSWLCIYGWVTQLALIMFMINSLLHAISVDWMISIQQAMAEQEE